MSVATQKKTSVCGGGVGWEEVCIHGSNHPQLHLAVQLISDSTETVTQLGGRILGCLLQDQLECLPSHPPNLILVATL